MQPQPQVIEVKLQHHYRFMYEAFVFSDQQNVYLFLERDADGIPAIIFNGSTFKFGGPNDEALGGHPLAKFGLGFYGLFEVLNSPWISDLCAANRVHPRHNDKLYEGLKHFVATFKDVTFEVICGDFEEKRYQPHEMLSIFDRIASN